MRQITRKVKDYVSPYWSEKELVSIFQPECIEMISEKINDWQEMCENLKKEMVEIVDNAGRASKKDDIELVEIIVAKFLMPYLHIYEHHVRRLKRLLKIAEGKGQYIENFNEKLERARSFPIYETARNTLDLKQSGKNFVTLCPYHNEKTPSCCIYIETNTFYCFGCHEKGDVIKLTMDLHGLDFKEAVEFLQN